jgi:rhodanese-related sulfurtransferase
VISEISVDELADLVERGASVIDVRMPDEYEAAHVAGAVLVPLPQVPERLGDVPDDATTYVICKAGGRSMKACEFLASQGYDVVNVAGGTDAWIESGRPTVAGPERG